MTEHTVGPIGRVVLGAPERCPVCGGRLGPAFGLIVSDDGRLSRPFVDSTAARCEDCWTEFKVVEKPS